MNFVLSVQILEIFRRAHFNPRKSFDADTARVLRASLKNQRYVYVANLQSWSQSKIAKKSVDRHAFGFFFQISNYQAKDRSYFNKKARRTPCVLRRKPTEDTRLLPLLSNLIERILTLPLIPIANGDDSMNVNGFFASTTL